MSALETVIMLLAVFCWPLILGGFYAGAADNAAGGSGTSWLFRIGWAMALAVPVLWGVGAVLASHRDTLLARALL